MAQTMSGQELVGKRILSKKVYFYGEDTFYFQLCSTHVLPWIQLLYSIASQSANQLAVHWEFKG